VSRHSEGSAAQDLDHDHRTKRLTVALKDINGTELFSKELESGKVW
jgi:hypothetical protein